MYNRAINLFNAERCEDAKPLLRELFEKYQDYEGSPQALACYALCFYKEGKCQETIAYYTMLLDRYPNHWLTEEARIHIERCEGKRAK
jgi:outer membrane protein assembly factor BamD (BamD/ComL family)